MTITAEPYQQADIDAFAANDYTGFCVADTGAGKTVIGAGAGIRSGAATQLVVAPQGTLEKNWRRTYLEMGYAGDVRRIDGTKSGIQAFDDLEWERPGVYLMSPQWFTKRQPLHLRPDLMIVDEAHLLGNREGKGGATLRKMGQRAGSRMALSGTMFRNLFENAWNLSRFVYPTRAGENDIADRSYNRWVQRWCATVYDHFAPGNIRVVGELVPGAFAAEVPVWRQHFKREQCCPFHPRGFLADLPEPRMMREYVELVPEQRKMMTQVQRDYLAWMEHLPTGDRRAMVTKLPIVQQLRLDQMTLAVPSLNPTGEFDDQGYEKLEVVFAPDAKSPKLDRVIEIYEKVQEPMVVGTKSKRFADMACARLRERGIRVFEWSSDASQKARDEALTQFEAGEIDIVFGIIEAIGTGIDGLQMASGVLVNTDKSRDLTSNVQMLGRLDRRGQKRKDGVLVFDIIAEDSSDEDVLDSQLERYLTLRRSQRRIA